MSKEITGNDLLAAAIGWYRSNGALPIPEKGILAGTRVNASEFHDFDEFELDPISNDTDDGSSKDDAICQIPGNVFPALAAISLGFDTGTLAQIFIDHSISLSAIRELSFNSETTTPILLFNQNNTPASPVIICIEAIKALASDPDLRHGMYKSATFNPSSRESIGLMHTNEHCLWPSARIEEHAANVMTPKAHHDEFVSFEFIASRPGQVSEFPNRNPIDLIRRAGMLTEPLIRKQTGLFSSWEDLLYSASDNQPMQIEMLKALTRVTDKPTIDLAVRGLLSATADSFEDDLDAEAIHPLLKSIFKGHSAFSPVLKSLAFKMNLIPLHCYPNELDVMNQNPAIFKDITSNQKTLVSRVAKEMLARPADHLGYSDYNVFRKLSLMTLPPQAIDFDPVQLVNHILDSISTYRTTNEITCPTKLGLDQWALDNLEVMAKLLMRDHQFDCSKFNDRDEASKVALIKAGFGIDLNTISRKARGHLLEDGLGL